MGIYKTVCNGYIHKDALHYFELCFGRDCKERRCIRAGHDRKHDRDNHEYYFRPNFHFVVRVGRYRGSGSSGNRKSICGYLLFVLYLEKADNSFRETVGFQLQKQYSEKCFLYWYAHNAEHAVS